MRMLTRPCRLPNRGAWQRALGRERGEAEAATVIARVAARYADLYACRKRCSHPALRFHLRSSILPVLALYQVFRDEGLDEPAALESVDRLFHASLEPARKRMALLGRMPGFFPLMRVLIRVSMRYVFPAEGWSREWVEDSAQRIAFNMRSCFVLETLREHGAPELTRVLCGGDDVLYERASPSVRWERTETLGRGHECCNFGFRRVRPSDVRY